MLYGPNTNLSHNSLILQIESQVNYMSVMIEEVLKARYSGQSLALTPKKDITAAYNERMQEGKNLSPQHENHAANRPHPQHSPRHPSQTRRATAGGSETTASSQTTGPAPRSTTRR